jgi:hypothetical protein
MKSKRVLRTIVVILIVFLALAAVLAAFLGPIVRTAVNAAGPRVLGVPVSVAGVRVNPLTGKAALRRLVVGNPPGFSTPFLFALEELRVDVEMRELLGGRVHIREVVVEGPCVWYERKLKESNVGRLQELLSGGKEKEKAQTRPGKKTSGGGGGVVIDRVLVKEGRIGLKVGIGGELPLPAIELKDLGKSDPEGLTAAQAVQRIVGAILDAAGSVIAGAGDLAVKGAKAIGSGVAEGGRLVGEGAEAAGKQAVKAAKAAGDALGGALKGVGGLLRGGKEEDKSPAKPAAAEAVP